MNPSGGLAWHWRAWRATQAGRAWAPTCAAIAYWLASFQPQSKKLLLLGPSAGWMLPTRWLLGFESVTAIDIDPLARPLFAQRHGRQLTAAGVPWRYLRQDALASLPALLDAHPTACLFFDNLLGQVRFHAGRVAGQPDTQAIESRLQAIARQVAGREWGSLHDLVSGPVSQSKSAIFPPVQSGLAGDEVDTSLFPVRARGPWLDHLTRDVFPVGTEVRRMAWAFSPAYAHVLEAGWVRAGDSLRTIDMNLNRPQTVHGAAL